MKKITSKDMYWVIDERIDRVVEQFDDKIKHLKNIIAEDNVLIHNSFNKLNKKIDDKIDTLIKKSESSFIYTDNYEDDIKKLENHLNNKIDDLNNKMKSLGIYNDSKCDDFPVIDTLMKLEDKIDDRVKVDQRQDEKIHKLEKKNKALSSLIDIMDKKQTKFNDVIFNQLNDKIDDLIDRLESLENKYKYMFNNKDIKHLMDKINNLEAFKKTAEEVISKLNSKIKDNESETMKTESLFMDRLERLERLERLQNKNDFNNVMGQAHETLKRVKKRRSK